MPAQIYPAQPPSFVVNLVRGWDCRVIYSFWGNVENYVAFDTRYTNLFDGIGDNWKGEGGIKNATKTCEEFFHTGKNLRICGRFFVTGANGGIFNMRVSIGGTSISAQNAFNNHELRPGLNNCPIDFEIILTSVALADDRQIGIQANGFYQYNLDEYTTGGENNANAYVPIFQTGYQLLSPETPTELDISFLGNAEISEINVAYIFIEELI